MRHEIIKSKKLLGITQAKAKMHEYSIPEEHHKIDNTTDPSKLFCPIPNLISILPLKPYLNIH